MGNTAKRILSIIVSIAIMFGLWVPVAATDDGYADVKGHWAEGAVVRWSGFGIIEGYDNNFEPDKSITRGQMAAIISRILGLEHIAQNPFTDVPQGQWYTEDVLKCYKAGIMLGDNGYANPESSITREEAMTMLCRALSINPIQNIEVEAFKDVDHISGWALPYVAALIDRGIVNGVTTDMLEPGGNISRGAVVAILDRAIVQYINTSGEYALATNEGIVLVAAGDVTVTGENSGDILITTAAEGKAIGFKNAIVNGKVTTQTKDVKISSENSKLPEIFVSNANGITSLPIEKTEPQKNKPQKWSSGGGGGDIGNLTITESTVVESGTYNNVTIASSVGDGEVTLKNVTILGSLTINGGGSDSVKLMSCTLEPTVSITVAKEGGETPRLEFTDTNVTTIKVETDVIIETADQKSEIQKVEASANVTVKGDGTRISEMEIPEVVKSFIAILILAGGVGDIYLRSPAEVDGADNSVENVVVMNSAIISSSAVQGVTIPRDAEENVTLNITGDAAIDVEVNSAGGAAITSESGAINLSTGLESTPEGVTLGGQSVRHLCKWGEPVTVDATCEADGHKTYTCVAEGCGQTPKTKEEIFPALGHKYGAWTIVDAKQHRRVCENDNEHIEYAAHQWDEGELITPPTADTEGEIKHNCAVCGGTNNVRVPATGVEGIEINLVSSENNSIIATWTGATAPSYYFEFVNGFGKTVTSGMTNADECYTPDLSLYLPRDAGTYPFVVYKCDADYNILDEIARIDDCAVVMISSKTAEYEMKFNMPDVNVHTITVTMAVDDALQNIRTWYRYGEIIGMGSGSNVTEFVDNHTAQPGDIFDLRFLTDYQLIDGQIRATMTEESTVTYTQSTDETEPATAIGRPELKTDGKKIWVEATAENLPEDAVIQIWASNDDSIYPALTVLQSLTIFEKNGDIIKCFLDPIAYSFETTDEISYAISIEGQAVKTEYTEGKIKQNSVSTVDSNLDATVFAGDNILSVTNGGNGSFDSAALYAGTADVTEDNGFVIEDYALSLKSITANDMVFVAYSDWIQTATDIKVKRITPTYSEPDNIILVDIQYYTVKQQ